MRIETKDGYIAALSVRHGTPISDDEYATITELFASMPTPPDGYEYRLRTDLTWELVELPPVQDAPTVYTQAALEQMTNAELTEILAALGISANMNKANMVRLILAAQEVGI